MTTAKKSEIIEAATKQQNENRTENFHIRLHYEEVLRIKEIAAIDGIKESNFVREAILDKLIQRNGEHAKSLHFQNIIREMRKNNARKEMTKSLYDQFLFKNATRSIFNLAMWQNERSQEINMQQIKAIIKKIIDIYHDIPSEIKGYMLNEKNEFEKLGNEEYLRKVLNIHKRLMASKLYEASMKEKENGKHGNVE